MSGINRVIERVVGLQHAYGWTDGRMAAEIGITRQHWNYLRRGRRQPEVPTLQAIAAAFPNLGDAVRFFVAPDVTKVAPLPPPRAAAARRASWPGGA